MVLERQGTEFAKDVLVEGFACRRRAGHGTFVKTVRAIDKAVVCDLEFWDAHVGYLAESLGIDIDIEYSRRNEQKQPACIP